MKKFLVLILLFISISVSAKFYKDVIVEDNLVLPKYNIYIENELVKELPSKDYIFIKSNCNNKTNSSWDNNKWIPLMNNIESNDTICNYYFKENITKSLKDTDINKYISIDNNIYQLIDIDNLELKSINITTNSNKYVKIVDERIYLNSNTYIEKGNGELDNPYIIR